MSTLLIIWLILGVILTAVIRVEDGPMRVVLYPVFILTAPLIIPLLILVIITKLLDYRI